MSRECSISMDGVFFFWGMGLRERIFLILVEYNFLGSFCLCISTPTGERNKEGVE